MDSKALNKRRQALIAALKDSSEAVRAAAAHSLECLEGLGSREEILDLLKKGNRSAKIKAIYALGQLGGEKAIPPLLYCISRPEEDIKSAAIEVLGKLANPSTLMPLVDKLKEPNSAIRQRPSRHWPTSGIHPWSLSCCRSSMRAMDFLMQKRPGHLADREPAA
ncbi:HEAT repeat domain-containing protein [Geotalea toluenoxydans]|uniref:HEAT repeat domain-containing protein n=1 Tax=Geotalea toluenoxydans TaxID=421624 RepID=UPI000AF3BFD2